ncbi:sugar ABC transporter ATP-binding protein [Salinisphaera sp.]|uniref:sugar ABC transporter ATP-binding protein n=1 Tax=Salinisphaera sp. TaxID=1914330 RepID=UPI002D798002|nr:sugar ABC transporter ATP-binding protein [Salinisphaera sp.]HET7314610.1 sugar ABC transporter ATP-binding protein [Salinisphaera sp.]
MNAPEHPDQPVLEARHITKTFRGFKALDDVSFDLRAGEVHGLMGENGAGKSTLIKTLTGFHAPDAGELRLAGNAARFTSPRESQAAGIAAVYQEINLIPERSVAENIMLGREPRIARTIIDRRRLNAEADALLARYGIGVNARTRLAGLGLGMQQMIAITRAVALGARVVILDEPTSALSGSEVDLLFDLVNRLRDDGVATLFVSHRLSECYALCDRLTVLRDGKHIRTGTPEELPRTELVTAMLGHEREAEVARGEGRDLSAEPRVLSTQDLCWRDRVRDVSIDVHAGEVVGLVGLLGSGRTETFKAIFGATRAEGGRITLDGTPLTRHTPAVSIGRGIAFLPEDRRAEGIFGRLPIRENMTATTLGALGRFGLVSRRRQVALVDEFVDELSIKCSGANQPISELSGGNQQKVLLARCLATRPRALLLDDPTRGIDVGAKDEVHAVIRRLAGEGIAVLITSSEVEELLTVCDRLIAISEGETAGELEVGGTSAEDVLALLAAAADRNPTRASA